MTIDKIKHLLIDVVFNAISKANKEQLIAWHKSVEQEINREYSQHGKSQRLGMLQVEYFYVNYRLGNGLTYLAI